MLWWTDYGPALGIILQFITTPSNHTWFTVNTLAVWQESGQQGAAFRHDEARQRERAHIDTEEEGGAVVRSCWGGRWESRAPTSGRSSYLQASGVQRDVHHKSDRETGPALTQTPMGGWILLHFTWIEAQLFLSILIGSQCFISLWAKSIR